MDLDVAASLRAVAGVRDRDGAQIAAVGACGWPAILRRLLLACLGYPSRMSERARDWAPP
jgi:hypothetical protein